LKTLKPIKKRCFLIKSLDQKFLKRFGKNLKLLMLSKIMNQEKKAYESKLTLTQIARIETSRINTSICIFKALITGLKMGMKSLLDF
jgi:transcriptional regulator with XRE-family HTH domain